MWKINYSWRHGNASSAEVEYFETEERFEDRLFGLLLLAEENAESRSSDQRRRRRWFRTWGVAQRRKAGELAEEYSERKVTKINVVAELRNDEWVALRAWVTSPELHVYDLDDKEHADAGH